MAPAAQTRDPAPLPGIVGADPRFVAVVERARTAGRVLVLSGEPGTGKRTLARALHVARTGGADGLVDASSLANVASLGPGVTVVASDVVDLGGGVQYALANALRSDTAHLVLCTSSSVAESVSAGRLRADLVSLPGTVVEQVPALRDRRGDVPVLVEHFLATFCSRRSGCVKGMTPTALAALGGYSFPGNLAELRTIVERAIACGQASALCMNDLPDVVRAVAPAALAEDDDAPLPTLLEAETDQIRRALARHEGNKAGAARALGISRQRLYDKLRRSGLR